MRKYILQKRESAFEGIFQEVLAGQERYDISAVPCFSIYEHRLCSVCVLLLYMLAVAFTGTFEHSNNYAASTGALRLF